MISLFPHVRSTSSSLSTSTKLYPSSTRALCLDNRTTDCLPGVKIPDILCATRPPWHILTSLSLVGMNSFKPWYAGWSTTTFIWELATSHDIEGISHLSESTSNDRVFLLWWSMISFLLICPPPQSNGTGRLSLTPNVIRMVFVSGADTSWTCSPVV